VGRYFSTIWTAKGGGAKYFCEVCKQWFDGPHYCCGPDNGYDEKSED